jgi:hypothetical protein
VLAVPQRHDRMSAQIVSTSADRRIMRLNYAGPGN